MRSFTSGALALSLTLGCVGGLSIGCDDTRTVESHDQTRTNSDGTVTEKHDETRVNTDTGQTTHERTTERH